MSQPNDPYRPPQTQSQPPFAPGPQDQQGDATGGVIPYKNAPALMAYYLGIFSFIPCLGLPLGIAAFVLGIMGLKKRKQNPAVKGSAHAWIGIVVGGFFTLLWAGLILLGIIGIVMEQQ